MSAIPSSPPSSKAITDTGTAPMVEAPMAESASDTLLSVNGLEAGYGEVQVLWGLSLKARRGKLTAIVGANGAGKTTTLRAVAGTLTPWGGRVMLDGEDVIRVPSHAKAARRALLCRAARAGVCPVSAACRAAAPARRHALRRRAADGRDCARADVGSANPHHRRAVARARAGRRLSALGDIEAAQAKRPDHFAGRAECASRSGAERLRLRHRRRPHLHRGPAGTADRQPGNSARLFGAVMNFPLRP